MINTKEFRRLLGVLALIACTACVSSFLLPDPANAALRAVAGGGSGGSTPPAATCSNNGGVVYASAGAFICNSSFTTDGAGTVSASAGVSLPANAKFLSGGTYIQGTSATDGTINTGSGNVGTLTIGGGGVAAQLSLSAGTVSVISSTFNAGVVSAGSITANTNGIAPASTSVGFVSDTTVASGSSVVTATTVVSNITSVSLSPGLYLVMSSCQYALAAASVTVLQCALGTANNALLTQAGGTATGITVGTGAITIEALNLTTTSGTQTLTVPATYVKVTSTANLFLNTNQTFSAGQVRAYGDILYLRL